MAWDDVPPDARFSKKVPTSSGGSWDELPPDAKYLKEPEGPTVMDKILTNVVVPVGRFIDTYTGAPSRAALGAAMNSNGLLKGADNASSAFVRQFGDKPENAPTGKELAKRMNFSETALSEAIPSIYSESGEGLALKKGGFLDPTASGAAGLGLDIATDWTNLIPGAVAIKGAAKAAKATTKGAIAGAAKLGPKIIDVATGTRGASKAAEATGDLASKTVGIIDKVLNPKQSPGFIHATEVAKKNGIDPALLGSSIEFGKSSSVSRLERSLREGPTGEKLFDSYAQGYDAISEGLQRKVQTVSGRKAPLNEIESGELIRGSFARAQDDMFKRTDMTYKNVIEYAPGLQVNRAEAQKLGATLGGVEKYAKGLVKRGIDKVDMEQGRQLLRAVEAVRATNGSYKQTVEALQMIGRKAFNNKTIIGQVPPDIDKLQDIYFKMSDALINTIRKDVNPAFADELLANNKIKSEFFGNRSAVRSALESGKADENLFRALIGSGDSKKIGALKKMLRPEDIQTLKGAFLNSIIRPNTDGAISFAQVSSAMRVKKNQIAALFDPKEIQEIAEIVKLGSDYGPAILSHSGTGASNSFRKFGDQVVRGLLDEKALDAMKTRARGGPGLLEAKKGLIPAGDAKVPALTLDTKKLRRGPTEKRLKGAQSVSPGYYTREDE